MKDGKGLLKTAGVFGFLLTLSVMLQRQKAKLALKAEKKRFKKSERKMKKSIREMEEAHACPPVRIPTDPNSRN